MHTDEALGLCPKRVFFRHEGPVFYGVVPEKGRFQARGSGFLWGRARKGAALGTGVASVRPDVPKASGQRARYAEV